MVREFTTAISNFSIAKVDSKGRISIPIALRAKLNLLEGTRVKIVLNKGKLIIIPKNIEQRYERKKKTIGILGGMGPEASAEVYMKIINFCQKKYGAREDKDYPRIVINSIPAPPMIDNLEVEKDLLKALIDGVKNLEISGADFIIISCNTAHYFLDKLKKQISIPILSIIEETVKRVRKKKLKQIGLLATTTAVKLYEKELNRFGINIVTPDEKYQNDIVEIIKRIVAGEKLRKDKIKLKKIIYCLKRNGAKGIILGCTDLPIIVKKNNFDIEIFDTTKILAEAAVDRAYGE